MAYVNSSLNAYGDELPPEGEYLGLFTWTRLDDGTGYYEISLLKNSFVRFLQYSLETTSPYNQGTEMLDRPLFQLVRTLFVDDSETIERIRAWLGQEEDEGDGQLYRIEISPEESDESIFLGKDQDRSLYLAIKGYHSPMPSIAEALSMTEPLIPEYHIHSVPRTLRIFNVGQASFCEASNGHGTYIAFDIGLPHPSQRDPLNAKEKKDIQKAEGYIKNRRFKAVVISHFDYDHISGYLQMTLRQLRNTHWYIPDPRASGAKTLSGAAKWLLIMLCGCRSFSLVGRATEVFANPTKASLLLYPGHFCGSKHCSLGNQLGLCAVLRSLNGSVLLPGDSMPFCWDPEVHRMAPYDLLLAPHHGAKTCCGECCHLPEKYFVISYGTRNAYRHPSKELVRWLQEYHSHIEVCGSPFFSSNSRYYSFSTRKLK